MNDSQAISCEHEGIMLRGLMATPAGRGPHPAVLVVHTAYGLGEHMKEVAARLAAEGYLALAVDMFGDGAYSENHSDVAEFVKPLWGNCARLRARMGAWHDVLKAMREVAAGRIAALGYCFGGQCVLEFARSGADVRAVVSFHGILTTDSPAKADTVRAHVAVFSGALDPNVPRAHVEALREELIAAKADWQITEFGQTYHAFTDTRAAAPEAGRQYDPLADEISWANTLILLKRRLRA
jgi:dienelactone hydrolase